MIRFISYWKKYQRVELGPDAEHYISGVVASVDRIDVQRSAPFVQPFVIQIVNERDGPVVDAVVVAQQIIYDRRSSEMTRKRKHLRTKRKLPPLSYFEHDTLITSLNCLPR